MSTPIRGSGLAQRVLAFTALGLVLLSLAAFFAELIGAAAGAGAHDGFARGLWPLVLTFPGIGLPVGFVLIVVLLVVDAVRRGRVNREAALPVAHAGGADADDGPEGDRRR